MLQRLRQRIDRELEGFTLIELMVVVLIIAILIAIAIPTFLGAQNRARDRAAQSNIRNALTAAKTIATDHDGSYLKLLGRRALLAVDMTAAETAITFADRAPARLTVVSGTVYVQVVLLGLNRALGLGIMLEAFSKSNNYWALSATSNGLVRYCARSRLPIAFTALCTLSSW